ncbi:MAG TPA: fused MFS/spermidine synthase [Opitutus sp.]|nr:fused MFS/spermidine synthase [Opitutus sp.]
MTQRERRPARFARIEWGLAIACVAAALALSLCRIVPLPDVRGLLGSSLRNPYFTGPVAVLLLVWSAQVLQPLSRRDRARLRIAGLVVAALATAHFFHALPAAAADQWIARFYLSAALGAFVGAVALAVYLNVSGLIGLRPFLSATVRWLEIFGPFAIFIVSVGYGTGLIGRLLPAVADARLLRMDASLGFHAAVFFGSFDYVGSWLWDAQYLLYAGIGALVMVVAGRLFLAGDERALRHFLLSVILVGLLGWIGYWLLPTVGPIPAFPEFFAGPAAGRHAALAAAVARATPLVEPAAVPRDCTPSLHTAWALVVLIAAWRRGRRFFRGLLPFGAMSIVTTLTLCQHYFADLVAAVPLVVLCDALVDELTAGGPAAAGKSPARLPLAGALILSIGAFTLWARFAPLPVWLAWPAVVLIIAGPVWVRRRSRQRVFRDHAGVGKPPARVAPAGLARAEIVGTRVPVAADWRVRLLAAAVFCSGGIALVLEQLYEKYLSTIVGSSRPAATIVLVVYFAGLALGAWLCPKKIAGAPRRLAALELFVAAWAVLVGTTFFAADRYLAAWLAGAGNSAPALLAIRCAIAALWILPPTLAMGAQLPTLAAVLSGHPRWHGLGITRFYAINLAGAFAFTVATPPLLFNTVGADGALWTIAALGLVVALALWFGLTPASSSTPSAAPSNSSLVTSSLVTPLAIAFAAGFTFFALEVVWFHLISAVCGASTYSFSTLLAVVLLGLALAGRRATHARPDTLAPTLGWLVASLAASNALWPWAGRLTADLAAGLGVGAFWAGEALKAAVVALLVLPPATGLGRIFPLLLRATADDSAQVGRLSVANILGCVAGALVAGFALIPALGAERTLLVLTLLAAAAWLASRPGLSFARLAPVALGLLLLILLPRWNRLELTRGFGVYLDPHPLPAGTLSFFREDFRSGFVTVVETPSSDRPKPVKTLLQNGKFDADDANEMPAQLGFGLVAALHAPARDNALVIGCGSGQTAGLIARLGFARVDLAELSPAHLAAARAEFSSINARLLDRPNVTVHVEDGRNFLLRSPVRYDVIQIELTSVWFAGATNLYSREFYALARSRLAPGGVLVQWIQLHHLTPRELACVFATAQAEFPFVSVWRAGWQTCLLASMQPPALNPAVWDAWRHDSDLFDERVITGLITPEAFAATELLPAGKLRALLARTPAVINTDRNRWLEFQTPKYYLDRSDLRAANLRWLESSR